MDSVRSSLIRSLTVSYIQSNFNGSNTFGTMKISSRQGKLEPMRVDYSGIMGIIFCFSLTRRYVVGAILMSTHHMPLSI